MRPSPLYSRGRGRSPPRSALGPSARSTKLHNATIQATQVKIAESIKSGQPGQVRPSQIAHRVPRLVPTPVVRQGERRPGSKRPVRRSNNSCGCAHDHRDTRVPDCTLIRHTTTYVTLRDGLWSRGTSGRIAPPLNSPRHACLFGASSRKPGQTGKCRRSRHDRITLSFQVASHRKTIEC